MNARILCLATVGIAACAFAAPARADTHFVNIVNASSAVMTSIVFSPPGTTSGANRLRSTLPPAIAADFPYSSGCLIDIRVGYADGGTEQKTGVDACANPRVIFGPNASSANSAPSAAGSTLARSAAASAAAAPPQPPAPAWNGHAITKRFGMDGWVNQ